MAAAPLGLSPPVYAGVSKAETVITCPTRARLADHSEMRGGVVRVPHRDNSSVDVGGQCVDRIEDRLRYAAGLVDDMSRTSLAESPITRVSRPCLKMIPQSGLKARPKETSLNGYRRKTPPSVNLDSVSLTTSYGLGAQAIPPLQLPLLHFRTC